MCALKPAGDEERPSTPNATCSVEKSPRFMRKKEVCLYLLIMLTVVILSLLHNAENIPKAEHSHTSNSAKRSVIYEAALNCYIHKV